VDKKWMIYAGLVLLGVVLAGRIRSLPGGSKLPAL
jgi:hypothetical protein